MRSWFAQLAPREQLVLLGGGFLLLVLGFFVLITEPAMHRNAQAQARYKQTAKLYAELERTSARVAELTAVPSVSQGSMGEGDSLVSVINRTAKRHNVAASIKRLNPQGSGAISISLQDVAFDDFVAWLVALNDDFGVDVQRLSANQTQDSGWVNATVQLAP
ncbi:MAG: type II secretion system protein GspM [Pseudomonadota bacterium]